MPAYKPRVALAYAPFGFCSLPSPGISILKSALKREGIPCDIHYLNLLLADQIGMKICDLIALGLPQTAMVGEWLFVPFLLGKNARADSAYLHQVLWRDYKDIFTPAVVLDLLRIRECLAAFLDACLDKVDWSQYDWIGFSTLAQQSCASLVLAQRIKVKFPKIHTVFGGANCFGGVGAALCRLFPFVDFVCTGYGEIVFPSLVQAVAEGGDLQSIPGIIHRNNRVNASVLYPSGEVNDLDALPYPDYSDYFDQLKAIHTPSDLDVHIPLEASRGCWWGEKKQCTFCGQNATERTYRCKTPKRFLDEINSFCNIYGNKITLTDNILPKDYFQTVLPELARRPGLSLFCEVKANLSREQVLLLANAGAKLIQVGIELLSDSTLRLIRKGTSLTHNIQILKWGKQFGIEVVWNLLWGFPGEDPAEYKTMQRLMRQLTHLNPPIQSGHIRIDRFSAYWVAPQNYSITNLRPALPYRLIYHSLAENDLIELAYHFEADYSDASASYSQGMMQVVKAWQACKGAVLDVFPSDHAIYIVDTRQGGERREYSFDGLAAELYLRCDTAQSGQRLIGVPSVSAYANEAQIVSILEQFVEQGLMIHSGGQYLSLAVIREGEINAPMASRISATVNCERDKS